MCNIMKKLMVVSMLAMSVFAATAYAAEEGGETPADGKFPSSGVVKFHGAVVESPCFLSLESAEQTIELGDIAKSQLDETDGHSPAKPFEIKLEKCDATAEGSTFTISFTGASSDKEELSVVEPERGVAVVINNKDGKSVSFDGKASADIDMTPELNIIALPRTLKKPLALKLRQVILLHKPISKSITNNYKRVR